MWQGGAASGSDTAVSCREFNVGLQAEEVRCVLEGGQGTGGGKGGLQMSDDLGFGPVGGHRRRWASFEQHGTDHALGQLETLPDSLPGTVTSLRHGSCCYRDASGDDLLQESPHYSRTEAQATNLVCQPDAERPSATTLSMPVAAIDAPCPQHLSLALVVPHQATMPIQRSHHLTMGTRRHLQPFHPLRPLGFRAIKPTLHDPPEIPLLPQQTRAREWRGREICYGRGARETTAPVLPNSARTPPAIFRWQFG